jgi:formylglycine-generating enzyme required for sulfatase activity
MPTASFPGCVDAYGALDVNGNVWELVDTTDGLAHYRGGAYNCSDSEALHRCDHDGTWNPSARGFRCCQDLP